MHQQPDRLAGQRGVQSLLSRAPDRHPTPSAQGTQPSSSRGGSSQPTTHSPPRRAASPSGRERRAVNRCCCCREGAPVRRRASALLVLLLLPACTNKKGFRLAGNCQRPGRAPCRLKAGAAAALRRHCRRSTAPCIWRDRVPGIPDSHRPVGRLRAQHGDEAADIRWE